VRRQFAWQLSPGEDYSFSTARHRPPSPYIVPHEMSTTGTILPPAIRPRPRWGEALEYILIWVVTLVFGFAAYKVAGHYHSKPSKAPATTEAFANLQNLVQLSVAVVVGVGTFALAVLLKQRFDSQHTTKYIEALGQMVTVMSTLLAGLSDLRTFEAMFKKDEALLRARNLQASASQRVDAMWTLLPYDDELEKYFAETLSDTRLFTRRIIAARTVSREALLDHIDKSWKYLAGGSYEIFLVRECNYEALMVDSATAGLFFYSAIGYGSLFLSSASPQVVQVVTGLFHDHINSPVGGRLPVAANAPKDLEPIKAWLDAVYGI
jgi:hypothetical protein